MPDQANDPASNCQNSPDCLKKAAFHNICMDAWVQTRMEKDRQLLTLSSLALGLLMIFYKDLNTLAVFLLWLFAAGCFLACILVVLHIFSQNADYLIVAARDDLVSTEKANSLGKSLKFKTKLVEVFFVLGVITTLSIAVIKTGFYVTKDSAQKVETTNSEPQKKK